jgi:hypothetical protein
VHVLVPTTAAALRLSPAHSNFADISAPVEDSTFWANISFIAFTRDAYCVVWTYSGDSHYKGDYGSLIVEATEDGLGISPTPADPCTFGAPSVEAPANVNVAATDCFGATVSDATLGSATASGGIGDVSIVRSAVPALNKFPVGTTLVTYTATDSAGQESADTQTVDVDANKASTTTTISSSVNPNVHGQRVRWTAVVRDLSLSGTPYGFVQFRLDGQPFGSPVALDGAGHAVSPLAGLSTGFHRIRAVYAGNASYFGSSSGLLGQTVNKAATRVAVSTAPNPSSVGQPVQVRANVSVVAPGAGVPQGTVQFYLDGNKLGAPVALQNGVARRPVNGLAAGGHTFGAMYLGQVNFQPSGSPHHSHQVN